MSRTDLPILKSSHPSGRVHVLMCQWATDLLVAQTSTEMLSSPSQTSQRSSARSPVHLVQPIATHGALCLSIRMN